MDVDSLNQITLSSGRRIKPKRNFSPEQSLKRSNNFKKENNKEFVDFMSRKNLIQQLLFIPNEYYVLPNDILLSETKTRKRRNLSDKIVVAKKRKLSMNGSQLNNYTDLEYTDDLDEKYDIMTKIESLEDLELSELSSNRNSSAYESIKTFFEENDDHTLPFFQDFLKTRSVRNSRTQFNVAKLLNKRGSRKKLLFDDNKQIDAKTKLENLVSGPCSSATAEAVEQEVLKQKDSTSSSRSTLAEIDDEAFKVYLDSFSEDSEVEEKSIIIEDQNEINDTSIENNIYNESDINNKKLKNNQTLEEQKDLNYKNNETKNNCKKYKSNVKNNKKKFDEVCTNHEKNETKLRNCSKFNANDNFEKNQCRFKEVQNGVEEIETKKEDTEETEYLNNEKNLFKIELNAFNKNIEKTKLQDEKIFVPELNGEIAISVVKNLNNGEIENLLQKEKLNENSEKIITQTDQKIFDNHNYKNDDNNVNLNKSKSSDNSLSTSSSFENINNSTLTETESQYIKDSSFSTHESSKNDSNNFLNSSIKTRECNAMLQPVRQSQIVRPKINYTKMLKNRGILPFLSVNEKNESVINTKKKLMSIEKVKKNLVSDSPKSIESEKKIEEKFLSKNDDNNETNPETNSLILKTNSDTLIAKNLNEVTNSLSFAVKSEENINTLTNNTELKEPSSISLSVRSRRMNLPQKNYAKLLRNSFNIDGLTASEKFLVSKKKTQKKKSMQMLQKKKLLKSVSNIINHKKSIETNVQKLLPTAVENKFNSEETLLQSIHLNQSTEVLNERILKNMNQTNFERQKLKNKRSKNLVKNASNLLTNSSSKSSKPAKLNNNLKNFNNLHYALEISRSKNTSRKSINIDEILNLRKRLNPLSIGLKNDYLSTSNDDYFFRQILLKDSETLCNNIHNENNIENNDIEIDINVGVEPEISAYDEIYKYFPAEYYAKEIQNLICNNQFNNHIENIDFESIEEYLQKKILNEPNDVANQLAIFLKNIFLQRLVDLTSLNICGGGSMVYSMSIFYANRLRESLRLYNKDLLNCAIKSHCWLLYNLPIGLLISYLNLLRFCKIMGSNLSDYLLNNCYEPQFEKPNQLIREFLSTKILNPSKVLNENVANVLKMEKLKNVCVLLIYPQIRNPQVKGVSVSHPWDFIFKHLFPEMISLVEKLELNVELQHFKDRLLTIEEYTLMCVQLIQKYASKLVSRRPNDYIFLVGWSTSALLNHKALTNLSGISGLIDFAFPTESASGPRGDVEDDICFTYCPTLFIVGSDAVDMHLDTLQDLRKHMIMNSGVVIVGEANHNLLVSPCRLNIERICQKCVDIKIMQATIEFIRQVINDLGPPTKECRNMLKPLELPQIYDVDINTLKYRPPPSSEKEPKTKKSLINGEKCITKEKRKFLKDKTKSKTKKNNALPTLLMSNDEEQKSPQMGITSGFCTPPSNLTLSNLSKSNLKTSESSLSSTIVRKSITQSDINCSNSNSNSLFSARNILNNSLKKVNTIRSCGQLDNDIAATNLVVKIPTPSMLNQQLPPPLPTISSSDSVNDCLNTMSSFLSKTSPISNKTTGSIINSSTTTSQISQPLQNFHFSSQESALTVGTDDAISSQSSLLLQEEQAAAAALLGQLSNF